MKSKKKGKILAVILSGMLLGTQIPAMAASEAASGYTGGICEHHSEHTAECGYQEAVPEQPCLHVHTEECYEYVTSCVHEHTEECYPLLEVVSAEAQDTEGTEDDAGSAEEPQTELVRGSEPTACTHICSEESGCVTKSLNCIHEDKINADGSITYAVHDKSCGYAPAVEGKDCTFVCGICSTPEEPEEETEEETVGEQEDAAVTALQKRINELPDVETVKQMTSDEQNAVYNQAQNIADTYYDQLTAEQQGQVDLTRLMDLMNFFNEQVSTMADIVDRGLGWSLDSDGVLTITSNMGLQECVYVSKEAVKEIFISDDVTAAILPDVFNRLTNVAKVTIGNNVERIYAAAFKNCTSLAVVTIGNNVKSIDDYTFSNCTSLAVVTIGNNVKSIGDYAFENCASLAVVTIGNNVESIGDRAFTGCSSLSEITIPESVRSIGSEAFGNSWSYYLTKVNLPAIAPAVAQDSWGWDRIDFQISEGSIGTGAGQYDLTVYPWNQIKKLNGMQVDNGKLVIDSVAVELDEPKAEEPLAETVECYTSGVSLSSIKWTTGEEGKKETVEAGTTAEFGTTYTATVTLSLSNSAVYKFTDQTAVKLNEEQVTGIIGDDGSTLTLTKEYTTEEIVAVVTFDGMSHNYASLDEAFAAASDKTAIIELKKNASFSSTVTITGNVTFKGEGFTATSADGTYIYVNGTFAMESGTITLGNVGGISCNSGGTVDISEGTISSLSLNGGTADISGGTITKLLDLDGTVTYSATSIKLDKDMLSLAPGGEGQLTAEVAQNLIKVNGSSISVPVTWKSSDTAVAMVTPSDDGRTATITAVGPGEATITAAAGTPTATCKVTVEKNTTTITNNGENGYPVSFIYGDTIPEPTESNFTIEGSEEGFSYQWYSGDHTAGELPSASIVSKPDAAGTYTLVVTTTGTDTYSAGELRLPVTIAAAEYHITIPGSVKAGEDEVSVSITENSTFKIGSNGKVRVKVSSGLQNGTVTLTQQNAGENPAEIISKLLNGKDGSPLNNDDTVALYDASQNLTEDTTSKLYFTAPEPAEGDVIPAGSYSGTVTFQISYETPQEESAE